MTFEQPVPMPEGFEDWLQSIANNVTKPEPRTPLIIGKLKKYDKMSRTDARMCFAATGHIMLLISLFGEMCIIQSQGGNQSITLRAELVIHDNWDADEVYAYAEECAAELSRPYRSQVIWEDELTKAFGDIGKLLEAEEEDDELPS